LFFGFATNGPRLKPGSTFYAQFSSLKGCCSLRFALNMRFESDAHVDAEAIILHF
jgi:hypothetical protein